MDLVVVPTEVTLVLSDIRHSSEGAVKCRIEDGSLPVGASANIDFAKRVIPHVTCLLSNNIEIPSWDFTLQVLLSPALR